MKRTNLIKTGWVALIISGSALTVVYAQSKPPAKPVEPVKQEQKAEEPPPELEETKKQQVIIAVQQVEILSLRSAQIQAELQKATEAAQTLVGSVCGEKHRLDLQTLKCVKPEEK